MDDRPVLVIDESGASRVLPQRGTITIGRDPSSEVVLESSTVSRRHAILGSSPDGWFLTDEGSSNGTFVDDRPVVPGVPTQVGVGSRLRFGSVSAQIRRSATSTPPSPKRTAGGPMVFVSYSRQDARPVDRLVAELERRGIDVWVDRSGLVGSADWTTEIVAAITNADAFLVVLSRRSIESDDVANEVHLAGARNLPVFPVLLERVAVPETLEYHLAGRQQYDLTGDDTGVELDRLVAAITSPRVRRRTQLSAARRLAVVALAVALIVGIPTVILSVLTGSVPPDLGRITGSRLCDGLDVELTTDDVTTIVSAKTAHLTVSFANDSDTSIDLSDWSVDVTSGAGTGEPYRFIENSGVDDPVLDPGERTVGRISVSGSFAPSDGNEPVRLVVSGLEQGDSVFAKCRATALGEIRWR